MSNYKTVFFTLGILQMILGISMIFPIIIQIIFEELDSSFVSASIITIIFGALFFLSNIENDRKINLQQAFLLTSLSWLSVAIFGSLPFVFSDLNLSITDSFFESMSGITTTGSTIITNLNDSPKAILLWRAMLQWLGGIGIIVIALFILPFLRVGGMQLFHLEGDDPYEKFLPKISSVISKIVILYVLLTLLLMILYFSYGMNFFDALAHSFTTISTGGFSTHDQSFAYFQSNSILFIAIIFMVIGSLPFLVIAQTSVNNVFATIKDHQVRIFLLILFVSIFIIYLFAEVYIDGNFFQKIISISFNTISIISGTGYVSENFESWGNYASVLFLILMFIGGCAGSTTCGIKIFRLQILVLFIKNQIKKLIYPNRILVLNYNKEKIEDRFINSVIIFIFSYLFLFLIIAMLLSITGLDFLSAVSGAATSISNVGPGLGEMIGPNGNFSEVSNISKWILSFAMLLGRLEIFAVLVLFLPSFWRS